MNDSYSFAGACDLISPALIYYRDLIQKNMQKAIRSAHGAERLWPHVKSHKMADMIRLSIQHGITRFKCATIAEAEIAASCGSAHVVVAYPLTGPNIPRFVKLTEAYPKTQFYAIGDNLEMLARLGNYAESSGKDVEVLADVNPGMDRTGVPLADLVCFCQACAKLPGITLRGLHCYDGNRTEHEYDIRKKRSEETDAALQAVFYGLQQEIPSCTVIILGGTPSFPCHTDFPGAFFSPGTLFIYDYGYSRKYPDLPYTPAAAILTRVVSHPQKGIFTLDLGYKGIAADPEGSRGKLLGVEHCEELFQSEEHWVFRMKPGYEDERPGIGTELFVIPTHICPTSALYSEAVIVDEGNITACWRVSARDRKITI